MPFIFSLLWTDLDFFFLIWKKKSWQRKLWPVLWHWRQDTGEWHPCSAGLGKWSDWRWSVPSVFCVPASAQRGKGGQLGFQDTKSPHWALSPWLENTRNEKHIGWHGPATETPTRLKFYPLDKEYKLLWNNKIYSKYFREPPDSHAEFKAQMSWPAISEEWTG